MKNKQRQEMQKEKLMVLKKTYGNENVILVDDQSRMLDII